jgi:hypothetical protein
MDGFLALRPPALLAGGRGYAAGPRYGYAGRRGQVACVFMYAVRGGWIDSHR